MSRATDAIDRATGTVPVMLRAPYGAWSPAVLKRCQQMRLAPLDWSVDPRDWARPGAGVIVSSIMRHTRTGSITLEHDGGGERSQTVAALKIVPFPHPVTPLAGAPAGRNGYTHVPYGL